MQDSERLGTWIARWEGAVTGAAARGAITTTGVVIEPPATPDQLDAAEAVTGVPIPHSLRSLFLASRMVDVTWYLDDEVAQASPIPGVFSGVCGWNVAQLAKSMDDYRSWVANVFSDLRDPYDAVWHDKYPFMGVVNGDIVSVARDGRVVYLSHDGGAGHGCTLGADVFDFLDRWTLLGCPGPEDWQWLPFTSGPDSGLEPDGPNGLAWRQWIGLP